MSPLLLRGRSQFPGAWLGLPSSAQFSGMEDWGLLGIKIPRMNYSQQAKYGVSGMHIISCSCLYSASTEPQSGRQDSEAAAYPGQVESISLYRCVVFVNPRAGNPWVIIPAISDQRPVSSEGRKDGGRSPMGGWTQRFNTPATAIRCQHRAVPYVTFRCCDMGEAIVGRNSAYTAWKIPVLL